MVAFPSRTVSPAAWAVASGVAWGLARPDLLGGAWLLLGAWCAGRALTGRLLADALLGVVAGVTWFALLLAWVPAALMDFGVAEARPATALLVLIQGGTVALPWALASPLYARGLRPGWALGLGWLVATEPLMAVQPLPCPPALLLAGTVVALWPAAVGGAAALSGLAVGVGAGLPRPGAGVVLGAWFAFGGVWVTLPEPVTIVRFGVVQPDVGAFDARRASTAEERADRLLTHLETAAATGAELLVAPESAWPWDPTGLRAPPALAARLAALPPTVLGATLRDGPTNSLVALEGGAVVGRFDKVLRVPVTERRVLGLGRDAFVAGTRPRRLPLGGHTLGPLICYEDLHPGALREAVREGAVLLVAAAHDAWTGPEGGTRWHLAAARLAAVTTGRPVVRPTSSGISAAIDTAGRLTWTAPWVDGDAPGAVGRHAVVDIRVPRGGGAGVTRGPALAAAGLLIGAALLLRRSKRGPPPPGERP